MRRVLYVIISVFVTLCFCGASFSVAGDMEEAINAIDVGVASPAPGAIADKNYIRNVWVSNSTASDSPAVRVYSSGSSVTVHINYYMAAAGTILRYYFVGNAGGSLASFSAYSESVPSGELHKYLTLSGLAPGVYFFTAAIIIAGDNVMSPTPYWFVIE